MRQKTWRSDDLFHPIQLVDEILHEEVEHFARGNPFEVLLNLLEHARRHIPTAIICAVLAADIPLMQRGGSGQFRSTALLGMTHLLQQCHRVGLAILKVAKRLPKRGGGVAKHDRAAFDLIKSHESLICIMGMNDWLWNGFLDIHRLMAQP